MTPAQPEEVLGELKAYAEALKKYSDGLRDIARKFEEMTQAKQKEGQQ